MKTSTRYIVATTLVVSVWSVSGYIQGMTGLYFPIELILIPFLGFIAKQLFEDLNEYLKSRTDISLQNNETLSTSLDENIKNLIKQEVKNNSININGIINEETKDQLIKKIKSSISSESADDIIQSLKEKYEANLTTAKTYDLFSITTKRLNREVEAASKRSNLNLIIGVITSLLGFFILSYFVVTFDSNNKSIEDVLRNLIPKLSLVLFIEVFAYFFLKLYKETLHDIKFFQNELTNIESKCVALVTASAINQDAAKDVINNISNTERNFILKKGQTTVELEKCRVSESSTIEAMKSISSIFKNKS